MKIKELSVKDFEKFSINSKYHYFHQSINYALLKSEDNYEYELIGFVDEDDKILASALVLVKLINGYLYAYIPEGFIIDYFDEKLFSNFTKELKKYYAKENIAFIRINPTIPINVINKKDYSKKATKYNKLPFILQKNGYTKIDVDEFQTILPTITAIKDLTNFNIDNLNKNTKNKIRKGIRKGLVFEKGDSFNIDIINNFIKNKINKSEFHYNDYYNIFSRNESIDYFLVKIDYQNFLTNSKNAYEKELQFNSLLNQKVIDNPLNKNINRKLNSDKTLLSYKNDVNYATKLGIDTKEIYIAGALAIKSGNKVSILISGYDKNYKSFAPNYFLYYKIMEYYSQNYKYLDLNGISENFSYNSKYYGLNRFKLGFNPFIVEYPGEYDLILNNRIYNKIVKNGIILNDSNKKSHKKK